MRNAFLLTLLGSAAVGCRSALSAPKLEPAASIRIVVPGPANAVFIDSGATAQLHAVVLGLGGDTLYGRTILWTSTYPDDIAVDSTGKVTARTRYFVIATVRAAVLGSTPPVMDGVTVQANTPPPATP